MKAKDRLYNSWEVGLIESYLGDYAHHFIYCGSAGTQSALCIIERGPDGEEPPGGSFQLELSTSLDEKTVGFYIQPLDDEGETTEEYVNICHVTVSDPNSHPKMQSAVNSIFGAMDLEKRIKSKKK